MRAYKFDFTRERGIVWVCDIARSTKLLNDNSTAEAIEQFLPRFHWLSREAINAAGGRYIKWTGDGFLAWFPFKLHRELGVQAAIVLNMIWHLTMLCNVTRLEVKTTTKFRLRHGLTIEHDAVVTQIVYDKEKSYDLIGRAVVLAFRLSGIKTHFPGIVTQREIVDSTREEKIPLIHFKRLNLTAEDRLKYFKGEKWGTNNLVASSERQPRPRSVRSVIRHSKKLISDVENKNRPVDPNAAQILTLLKTMETGPNWSKNAAIHHLRFLREDLLGTLKSIVEKLELAHLEKTNGA